MAPRRPKHLLTYVVDTREQLPYEFAPTKHRGLEDGGTLRYALDAGDYSVELDGVLLPIRIERKSLGDYFGVCGYGRERFERELTRLQEASLQSYLVIEATMQDVVNGYERSQISGKAAICSAVSWSARFGIAPIFAGSRTGGQSFTRKVLESFAFHSIEGAD